MIMEGYEKLKKDIEGLKIRQNALEKFTADSIDDRIRGASVTAAGFNLAERGDLYSYSVQPIRVPVGADNHKLVADSSLDAGLGWVNDVKIITKTADQTIDTETTLQDVTGLVLALKADTRYYVLVSGRMISPSAADMDLTFEAIAGTDYAQFRITMGTGDLTNFGTESLTATSGNNQSLFLPAWLQTGAAGGTLQLQYAQNVSNAGDTSILEGSIMLVYELG